MLNLVELQAYLGNKVEKINDESITEEQRDREIVKAQYTAVLAKQMINNADVILRADKLYNEGGLKNSSIMGIIWDHDDGDTK